MYRSVTPIRTTLRPMKMIGNQAIAQFSQPDMKVPRRGVIRTSNRLVGAKSLLHNLQSGVRSLTSSDLGAFSSVHDHDVSREIVLSSEQGRTDPVGVDGNVPGLETGMRSASKPPDTTIFTRSCPAASSASRTRWTST